MIINLAFLLLHLGQYSLQKQDLWNIPWHTSHWIESRSWNMWMGVFEWHISQYDPMFRHNWHERMWLSQESMTRMRSSTMTLSCTKSLKENKSNFL